MASGIVSIGFEPVSAPVSMLALAVGLGGFVLFCVLMLLRVRLFPQRFLDDLLSRRRVFGFFTFVAAAGVLAGRFEDAGRRTEALVLGAACVVAWIVLNYGVPALLVTTRGFARLADVDGGWLLWVVATESVATLAAQLGRDIPGGEGALSAAAVCFWAAGAVLYLVLIVLVIARLFLVPVDRDDLTPAYWITMGATAITVLAGGHLLDSDTALPIVAASRSAVESISLLLWAFGSWWVPLLLVLGVWRYRRGPILRFESQLWSAVFPLGMYGTASRTFGDATGIGFIATIGRSELWIALVAWTLLVALMLRSFGSAVRHSRR
jgi:tellurite resistance protein TehA-like permease